MTKIDTFQQWFTVTEPATGVFAIAEPFHPEYVRSYLVTGIERAVLIDTGTGIGDIRAVAEHLTSLPVSVINSHAHWDHVGGNWQFSDIAIHPEEAPWLDDPDATESLKQSATPDQLTGPLPAGVDWESLQIRSSQATSFLTGGETLDLGQVELEVIHCPGHSPGLLAFLDRHRSILLSTDVVYPGELYAFGQGVDLHDYFRTLTMLAEMSPELELVLPCHSGDTLDPALIPAMRDAMAAVIDGRRPEATDGEKSIHHFSGFSIFAPLPHDSADLTS